MRRLKLLQEVSDFWGQEAYTRIDSKDRVFGNDAVVSQYLPEIGAKGCAGYEIGNTDHMAPAFGDFNSRVERICRDPVGDDYLGCLAVAFECPVRPLSSTGV